MSKIEWTDITWNPITGCKKISSGCQNCYAEKMHQRLMKIPATKGKYSHPFDEPKFHPEELEKLYKWKKGKRIFVCSMSDLFQEEIWPADIDAILKACRENPQHQYIFLTKRPGTVKFYTNDIPVDSLIGVTVEDLECSEERLVECMDPWSDKYKYFVSFEPLLENVFERMSNLIKFQYLKNYDWIIVGGETGPNARPVKKEWVMPILEFAQTYKIPFFFKQWNKKGDRKIDGKEWNQLP